MYLRNKDEVRPRNGRVLFVVIVARISGCQNQKELSLQDQEDHGKTIAKELFSGTIEFQVIATRGKGERLDRPELLEVEEIVRTGEVDLLIFEDVGRLVRGLAAHRLCGIAVDCGVRVISPNDFFDTAEENWEQDLIEACKEHMQHNSHTSRRLKHKQMNRYVRYGAATPLPTFGYCKPPDAKTFSDWTKQNDATTWITTGFSILRGTSNAAKVAEYFNDNYVDTGPYCRKKKWDGRMVLRFYRNPILIGKPGRGFRHTVKHNETGRRISVPNPKGPIFRDEPHLAFFDEDEWRNLMASLGTSNQRYKRKGVDGKDVRKSVRKSRTRPLGQHVRCWYCGAHYVWGGNGITEHLMCSSSREWKCWNSIGFDGPLATELLQAAITDKLGNIDGIEEQYRAILESAMTGNTDDDRVRVDLDKQQSALDRDRLKLKEAILSAGHQPLLGEMLKDLEDREHELALQWQAYERRKRMPLKLPATPTDLRKHLSAELKLLASDSWKLADLMRQLVPEIQVYLVRLCDGGHLYPRAKARLNLLGSFVDSALTPELRELLAGEVTLDLFVPPERELYREECVRLAAKGVLQREIASRLPSQPTQALVSKSIQLDTRMRNLGLSSPFIILDEPPADYAKLRRHRNRKYEFTPVPEHQRMKR